jgi:hypothetical protein
LLSEAEIVLRFAAYKLHSETGAVMVGSFNPKINAVEFGFGFDPI